jgi:glycosyltransferase involved in cell wall biosynthesis
MYPLDRGLWGATSRITQLRDALARQVDLEVVSGTRGWRSWALARYVAGGGLRRLDGVYVETSTSLPGPVDLAFLAIARARRVAVLTYLRDAQQLFAEYYPISSPKRWLSRALFLPAARALIRVSSRVAFPSRGLARAILGAGGAADDLILLPPGARIADAPPVDPSARRLLFVGALRYPAHGGDNLLDAVRLVRERGHDVRLVAVTRPGEGAGDPPPQWLEVERAEGAEIDRLLPGVLASITPRRRTPYNDLAVPIKVLEYLGYARPLIVTDTTETAAIVRAAGCGIVVSDSAEGLADGITAVVTADPEQIRRWGAAARRAAADNSWDTRARRIVELLGLGA